jgi:ribosomal protein L20A (L18A)
MLRSMENIRSTRMSKKKELTFDELTLDELEELSPEEIKELVLRELRYVDEDLSPEEAKRLAVEQLALKEEIMFEQLALKRPADEELGETIVNKLIHNEHSLNELEELTLEELSLESYAEVLALHFNVPTEGLKGLELLRNIFVTVLERYDASSVEMLHIMRKAME